MQWVLTPQQKYPPQKKKKKMVPSRPRPPNFVLSSPTGNKKLDEVKLMLKPAIIHNCQQIKNKMKSEERQYT